MEILLGMVGMAVLAGAYVGLGLADRGGAGCGGCDVSAPDPAACGLCDLSAVDPTDGGGGSPAGDDERRDPVVDAAAGRRGGTRSRTHTDGSAR